MSTFEKLVFFGLTVVEGALLHPAFKGSSSARWLRLSLGPLNACWWLYYPFRSSLEARQSIGILQLAFFASFMAFRSIEWGLVTGPYYLRSLKYVDGVPVWEKEPAPSLEVSLQKSDWREFAWWIYLLLTAQRGFRWSWGLMGKGNTNSFGKALFELIRLQLIALTSLAFLLHSQDRSNHGINPTGFLLRLGIPSFPGLHLLARCVHSASFMFLATAWIEMLSAILVTLAYPLYSLAKAIDLPSSFTEVLNPENYPPQFTSLLDLRSISHFWGKSWHQKFRRAFVFCGGQPAMSLSKAMGASTKVQKACGVIGAFIISGLFHEYPLYLFKKKAGPNSVPLSRKFPSSFCFFLAQSLGVILEQAILPRLPKRFGCNKIWTASFLLLTAPLFTNDFCLWANLPESYDYLRSSNNLIHWSWFNILVPAPIALFLKYK